MSFTQLRSTFLAWERNRLRSAFNAKGPVSAPKQPPISLFAAQAQDPLISTVRRDSSQPKVVNMSDLFWLSDEQMARLKPFFPKSHGKPRVDDRRVLSGIIFINRNGLRWRDAPREYGPHKTLYNRWKRWSDKGIFAEMLIGLAADHGEDKTVMIDATYLKAHRTASSLAVKKGDVAV